VNEVAEKMGLRDPIIVQYGRYIAGVVQGDFGQSYVRPRSGMVVAGGEYIDPPNPTWPRSSTSSSSGCR
jgi:hypothetical protein